MPWSGTMRSAKLTRRLRAATVVSKMELIIYRAMLIGYDRHDKNLAGLLPEIAVVMIIRINDDRGRPPISASKISKKLRMPRENVRRWLRQLEKHGVITKSGRWGYVGNDDYVEARLHAAYFR